LIGHFTLTQLWKVVLGLAGVEHFVFGLILTLEQSLTLAQGLVGGQFVHLGVVGDFCHIQVGTDDAAHPFGCFHFNLAAGDCVLELACIPQRFGFILDCFLGRI